MFFRKLLLSVLLLSSGVDALAEDYSMSANEVCVGGVCAVVAGAFIVVHAITRRVKKKHPLASFIIKSVEYVVGLKTFELGLTIALESEAIALALKAADIKNKFS